MVFILMVGMVMACCRYAEFSAAMVGINETFPHEQMNRLLALLQVIIMFYRVGPIINWAEVFGQYRYISIGQIDIGYWLNGYQNCIKWIISLILAQEKNIDISKNIGIG